MNDLLETLKTGKVLICDGAMGSELQKKGLIAGDCPDEWNVTHQKEIQQIHSEYLNAGANIILANSFGANRFKLKAYKKENLLKEFNIAAVQNALSARDAFLRTLYPVPCTSIFVFGDISSTGQIMEGSGGTLLFSDAIKVFTEQINVLAGTEIDGIIFETFEDLEEIKAGIAAAKELEVKFPIIASMTFHSGTRGFRTIMGTSVEKAVQELEKSGVDIIGTNCGNGPEEMTEIIKEMRKYTSLPLIAQPNAGMPILKEGKTIFPLTAEAFAEFGPKLRNAGANIIGGCCGTTPEHVKLLAEKIK